MKLAHYAANLPPDRWLARILTWTCRGHQGTGRPRNTWDTMIQKKSRYQQLGIWLDVARDSNQWSNLMPHFVTFCAQAWRKRSAGHCNVQSVASLFIFTCALHFTSLLSIHLFIISLFIYIYLSLSLYRAWLVAASQFIYLFICLSIYFLIYLCTSLSISPFLCLSVCRSVRGSVRLSIFFVFFFFPFLHFLFNRKSFWLLDCFTGQSPGSGGNELMTKCGIQLRFVWACVACVTFKFFTAWCRLKQLPWHSLGHNPILRMRSMRGSLVSGTLPTLPRALFSLKLSSDACRGQGLQI